MEFPLNSLVKALLKVFENNKVVDCRFIYGRVVRKSDTEPIYQIAFYDDKGIETLKWFWRDEVYKIEELDECKTGG